MGADPTREPPFFFKKRATRSKTCPEGQVVDHPYPPMTENYHFEAEMVVALKSGGRDIAVETALDHVFGYAVGLDMTPPRFAGRSKNIKAPMGSGERARIIPHRWARSIAPTILVIRMRARSR